MIRWEDGTDDIGVTRYELRYVREGASKEKTVKSAEPHCLLDNLAPGSYSYQVRAIDATGKTGEWSRRAEIPRRSRQRRRRAGGPRALHHPLGTRLSP